MRCIVTGVVIGPPILRSWFSSDSVQYLSIYQRSTIHPKEVGNTVGFAGNLIGSFLSDADPSPACGACQITNSRGFTCAPHEGCRQPSQRT